MSSKFQRLSDLTRQNISYKNKHYFFFSKDSNINPLVNIFYFSHIKKTKNTSKYLSRCIYTGRTKGVHTKFRMTRMVFKSFASHGLIPGVIKSSW